MTRLDQRILMQKRITAIRGRGRVWHLGQRLAIARVKMHARGLCGRRKAATAFKYLVRGDGAVASNSLILRDCCLGHDRL